MSICTEKIVFKCSDYHNCPEGSLGIRVGEHVLSLPGSLGLVALVALVLRLSLAAVRAVRAPVLLAAARARLTARLRFSKNSYHCLRPKSVKVLRYLCKELYFLAS